MTTLKFRSENIADNRDEDRVEQVPCRTEVEQVEAKPEDQQVQPAEPLQNVQTSTKNAEITSQLPRS